MMIMMLTTLTTGKDGVMIKDQQGILSRWAEHLNELLNCINPTDPTFIELIPQLPTIPDLEQSPTFHEIHVARRDSRTTKQPGQTAFLPKYSNTAAIISYIDSTASSPVLGPRLRTTAVERR